MVRFPTLDAKSPAHAPLLIDGDRMTRAEFHRRYAAMPDLKKAELVEGVVRLERRSPFRLHAEPKASLVGWVGLYCAYTSHVQGASSPSVILDEDNEVQPDVLLRILPKHGGATQPFGEFIKGPPEWVGEVSYTSTSYDLHDKKNAYRRNGVQEYLVWRVIDGVIEWHRLRDGRYHLLQAGDDGVLKSEVFPGLWLDARALLTGNMARVLEVLQKGLKSKEHKAFVARLEKAEGSKR